MHGSQDTIELGREKCKPVEGRRPPSTSLGANWLHDKAGHVNCMEWLSSRRLTTKSKFLVGSRLAKFTSIALC